MGEKIKIKDLIGDLSYEEIKKRKWRTPRLWRSGKKLLFTDYIMSKDGIVLRKTEMIGRTFPGKIIKSGVDGRGYLATGLRIDRKQYSRIKVHRLVWETWKSRIPGYLEMNHKDGVKTNNNLDNLEIVTHKENQRHAKRIGLNWTKEHIERISGEKNSRGKLTKKKVGEMRKFSYVRWWTQQRIADKFGVSKTCVKDVVNGYSWNPDNLTREELIEQYV